MAAIIERLMLGLGAKNASDLARKLGLTPGAVTNWKSAGKVGVETVVDAARAAGLSLSWVFDGIGPMRLEEQSASEGGAETPPPPPRAGEMTEAGIRRADTSHLENADPNDPMMVGHVYSGPADLALLRFERILALQERQAAELRKEIEEAVTELAHREG